jgi:hypothetical protein
MAPMNENSVSRWIIVIVIVFVLGVIVYGFVPSHGGGTSNVPGITTQGGP